MREFVVSIDRGVPRRVRALSAMAAVIQAQEENPQAQRVEATPWEKHCRQLVQAYRAAPPGVASMWGNRRAQS